jgi:hypothetical protein
MGNPQFEPMAGALARQPLMAAGGVARGIAGDEYRLRAGLRGEPDGFILWPAGPDHQVTAPGAQPLAQVSQGLQQEA